MRAAPGAIERVRVDPDTLEVKFKVIGRDEWSDAWGPREQRAAGQETAEERRQRKRKALLGEGRFSPRASADRASSKRSPSVMAGGVDSRWALRAAG